MAKFRSRRHSKQRGKTQAQAKNDWIRRRQNIARGIRIALHEVNQVLATQGVRLDFPPDFVPYTVAIAEGGRANACQADIDAARAWSIKRALEAAGFVAVPLR